MTGLRSKRALAFLSLLVGGAAIGFSPIFVRLADVGPMPKRLLARDARRTVSRRLGRLDLAARAWEQRPPDVVRARACRRGALCR
jgi:hypothetical protein